MEIKKVREKAQVLGIKPYGMKKLDLIMEIQKKEGNFPCFGTATDYGDQSESKVFRLLYIGEAAGYAFHSDHISRLPAGHGSNLCRSRTP